MHADVVRAFQPAFLTISGVLGKVDQPISTAALWRLKRFLTDPGVSPLFGTDPITARRAAEQLQYWFTDHPGG